jgi:hypothetical protein
MEKMETVGEKNERSANVLGEEEKQVKKWPESGLA